MPTREGDLPSERLTKRSADAAPPRSKIYVLYDIDLAGFGLRVMPSGHKTWIVEYRPTSGGRRASGRRMAIGSWQTLTAEEARRRAKDILAQVRLGGDPAGERQSNREMPTVSEFAERFIAEACVAPRLRPRTIGLYIDNLRRLAYPLIGKLKLDAVTDAEIARMHRKIGTTRPTSANNLIVTVASLFNFAIAEGLLPKGSNPARSVKKFKSKSKERYLSTDEFARLGDAIREAETVGLHWNLNNVADPSRAKHRPKEENRIVILPPDVAAALRLLIFTGCRKTEILGLRWSEVDFERGLLHLAETKTGRRSVVLNAPALSILRALDQVGRFVFPGSDPEDPRKDVTGYWYRVRARAGLDGSDGADAVRLHDLRHSFASFGVSGGMGLPIIGKLLGHTQSSTTARYAHLDADPVRKASERIGAEIARALDRSAKQPAKVVTLRRKQ